MHCLPGSVPLSCSLFSCDKERDWFCEEHDAYDGDGDDIEGNGEDSVNNTLGDNGEDPVEFADEDDDEQVFRLGD